MRSPRARLHLLASRAHKWLAIVVGAQLLLWFASGALMSFLPIDRVHGDHLVDRTTVLPLNPEVRLAASSEYLRSVGAPVQSITIRMLGSKPVAEIVTANGVTLVDAVTASRLPRLDESLAETIARDAWRGTGRPATSVTLVTNASAEYRGPLPAWRVAFADADATRVFIPASTGRIAAVRTGTWRLYDFFWGLHIMDWKNHENFNTPWLLSFALGGIVLWLGGAVLLYMRWPVRRRRSVSRPT
ncbi:MAG: PepSY domain-containing protein [Pseudomonadota bacterium]